jgi:hypothetical protein
MSRSREIIAWLKAYDASEKASQARAALPTGSSRPKVTTANARWTRLAEERDRLEKQLLPETVQALMKELGRKMEVKKEDPDQLKLFEEPK